MDDDSRIYELPLTASPTAADLKEVFAFDDPPGSARRPRCSFTSGADCPYPEGLAFGASGRLYVVLSGLQAVSVLEKGPGGFKQVGFYPTVLRTGETAGVQTVPYGIAFSDDGWIIVTNNSFLVDDPAQSALLRMYVRRCTRSISQSGKCGPTERVLILAGQNVVGLLEPDVEKPSDWEGVEYLPFGEADWQTRLANELRAAGFEVDLKKA